MRCQCCNALLSDYEATIRSTISGEYLDICKICLSYIPEIEYIDRPDLTNSTLLSEDFENDI